MRSLPSAARTSAVTCRVRCSSAARCRLMVVMPPGRDGSASPSYRYPVGCGTARRVRARRCPEAWPGRCTSRESAMVCRTGPTCMAIRSSSLSRRYGVAVSPSDSAVPGISLIRALERGGRDVVAFVGDDQAVPGGQLGDVVAAGQSCKVTISMEPRTARACLGGGSWPRSRCSVRSAHRTGSERGRSARRRTRPCARR